MKVDLPRVGIKTLDPTADHMIWAVKNEGTVIGAIFHNQFLVLMREDGVNTRIPCEVVLD